MSMDNPQPPASPPPAQQKGGQPAQQSRSGNYKARLGNVSLGRFGQLFQSLGDRNPLREMGLALGIITILVVLVLPMPKWLLDFGLAISITFSVLILMTVLFISTPLDFNSFPTVLLIATMIRLSLNLASTRLILANGHEGTDAAGQVIEAFGQFVMGGDFIIGVIVFSILVIVNFVVITKGSGRIAEVAARFSLDAMPGKQMAIDSDLSSGLIDENEARRRRQELEEESSFFGAMDGASKFVRGDAIAGLLITFINVIGGIIIGTTQQDLSLGEAANNYTLLTVGDGLVSQIPALIVSVAAGMLVSKAGVRGTADQVVVGQLKNYPHALIMVSVLLVALSLLPGIPKIPFWLLAALMGFTAWRVLRVRQEEVAAQKRQEEKEEKKAVPSDEPISRSLQIDQIRLEMGYGLLHLLNSPTGPKLTDQIKNLRKQMASELGFILPSVRLQDNLQLPNLSYVIRIKEIEAGRGDIRPDMLMVMDPQGQPIQVPGEDTKEPAFGIDARWIKPELREQAVAHNYTIVDPQTIIVTHLTEIIKEYMPDLLSYIEVQRLLDELEKPYQKLVSDVVPAQISLNGLGRVLSSLLTERVSIRDLPTILEAISEAHAYTRNIRTITEHVRGKLARQINHDVADDQGVIPLAVLSVEWEKTFAENLIGESEDKQLTIPPSRLQDFINKTRQIYEAQSAQGVTPVILTSPAIRSYVRSVIERFLPMIPVLSQNEIHPKAKIRTIGQI